MHKMATGMCALLDRGNMSEGLSGQSQHLFEQRQQVEGECQ